jgi:hypothetical protein
MPPASSAPAAVLSGKLDEKAAINNALDGPERDAALRSCRPP